MFSNHISCFGEVSRFLFFVKEGKRVISVNLETLCVIGGVLNIRYDIFLPTSVVTVRDNFCLVYNDLKHSRFEVYHDNVAGFRKKSI